LQNLVTVPKLTQQRLTVVLDRHGLQYDVHWVVGGMPFLSRPTPGDNLIDVVRAAVHEVRRTRCGAIHNRRQQ
jgi:succinyl-diaminopimelate desuccinylase